MADIKLKRVTILTGHYGSGKSEVCSNLAINYLEGKRKMIFDLDIVNPYFRTRSIDDIFAKHGIETIGSTTGNKNGEDLPYVSPIAYGGLQNKEMSSIYDLGGDGVGAGVLRQYNEYLDQIDFDFICVVNVFREKTDTATKIVEMVRKIEAESGQKITGLINNSNFERHTTKDDVLESEKIVIEASKMLNVNIIYTTVYSKVGIHQSDLDKMSGKYVPLELLLRQDWLK